VLVEPGFEKRRDGAGQAQRNEAGRAGAGRGGGLEDARDLGVGETGKDRRHEDAAGDAALGELANRRQAVARV